MSRLEQICTEFEVALVNMDIQFERIDDFDEEGVVLSDSAGYMLQLIGGHGLGYPIMAMFGGKEYNAELSFTLNQIHKDEMNEEVLDLMNYLMNRYNYLRWYVSEDGAVTARYSLLICEDVEETVQRLLEHILMFSNILDISLPVLTEVMWRDLA